MNIRKLTKSEIECRVAHSRRYESKTQITLLLYKDARVDQRILDETYTPFNWKRSHEMIGDRLYCTVSIYDESKGEWISKQDVGTESNTEPEKGQASDSFKRACFNWGIGRELYTAPRISFYLDNSKVNEKGQPKCSFFVDHIDYKDDAISCLVIKDSNNSVVFSMGGNENPPKEKSWITEGQLSSVIQRISNGDLSAAQKAKEVFLIKKEQWQRIETAINQSVLSNI